MDFEKSFVAPGSIGTAVPLVQGFFKAAGYRKLSEKPLVYRRGSLYGTWMSLEDSARAVASSGLRTVLVLVAGATAFFVVTYLLGYLVKRLISQRNEGAGLVSTYAGAGP